MRRARWLPLAAGVSLLSVLLSGPTSAEPEGSTLECHSPSKVTHIDAAGRDVESGSPDAATVYWFDATGDTRMIVPPPDFDFASAGDAQLEAWGYPPREDDTGVDWTKATGGLKPQVYDSPPTICAEPGVYAGNVSNAKWSGVVSKTSTKNFRRVYGTARIPTFSGTLCSGTTALALWVGLGGYGTNYLIQNGWVTNNGSPQGMFAWWEVVGPGGTGIPMQRTPGVGQANDLVKSDTYYNAGTDPDRIQFNWTDVSKGVVLTPVVQTEIVGDDGHVHGVHEYYEGSTSEVVDERIGSAAVRQFGVAGWTDMYGVRAGMSPMAIGNYSHDTLYLVRPGTATVLMHLNGNGLTSPTQMNVVWSGCA